MKKKSRVKNIFIQKVNYSVSLDEEEKKHRNKTHVVKVFVET